jgi:hypothetical protein
MDQLTLAMELTRLALSQYHNFDFNSIAEWHGRYFAAGKDGIYELEADDTDGGAAIPTRGDLPPTDFGTESQKRIRRIYVSGFFKTTDPEKGVNFFTIDDGNNERTYPLEIQSLQGKQASAAAHVGRDGKGRHWQIRWETDGIDYSFDTISLLVADLHNKPSGII